MESSFVNSAPSIFISSMLTLVVYDNIFNKIINYLFFWRNIRFQIKVVFRNIWTITGHESPLKTHQTFKGKLNP